MPLDANPSSSPSSPDLFSSFLLKPIINNVDPPNPNSSSSPPFPPHRRLHRRRPDPRPPQVPRPPCRPPPQISRLLLLQPGHRPARGHAGIPVLRKVRRPRLLRPRRQGQPQLRRAQGGRRAGAGGALRVAPREGDPRQQPLVGGDTVRHRAGQEAAVAVALRGAAGVLAGGGGGDLDGARERQRITWQKGKKPGSAEIVV
ncbi:Uncharacterized protein M6B38_245940 [Iris pallida]|uniref:Uncharacterized protein n=1 Tax=Iris pallida TaxID=29817 RepID=A0AAX6DHF1_IRIPA|nr:Uncharacterized protein M6B38_245940 [Iris pallida]